MNIPIHLVKHAKSGLGYAVTSHPHPAFCHIKVRFFHKIDRAVEFPMNAFARGDLIDLGVVDNTDDCLFFPHVERHFENEWSDDIFHR